MNERIRQLAEQCGFRSNPNIYDRNQSFDIQKFAQLIVKECVDHAHHQGHPDLEFLLKYFGVEE